MSEIRGREKKINANMLYMGAEPFTWVLCMISFITQGLHSRCHQNRRIFPPMFGVANRANCLHLSKNIVGFGKLFFLVWARFFCFHIFVTS